MRKSHILPDKIDPLSTTRVKQHGKEAENKKESLRKRNYQCFENHSQFEILHPSVLWFLIEDFDLFWKVLVIDFLSLLCLFAKRNFVLPTASLFLKERVQYEFIAKLTHNFYWSHKKVLCNRIIDPHWKTTGKWAVWKLPEFPEQSILSFLNTLYANISNPFNKLTKHGPKITPL